MKKNIHNENDLYLIPGHDLNKMIAVTKLLLKLEPSLDKTMMNWLGYLHEIKPQDNDYYDWHDYWDDDFVKQDGSVEHDDLNDLIWKLGMNLPSWDDDDSNSNGDKR